MREYKAIEIVKKDLVATITILTRRKAGTVREKPQIHPELGSAFNELREDNSIRVIVLTGSDGRFHLAPLKESYINNESSARFNEPANMWNTHLGIMRCHQAMAEIEKPIVAKVNGDAIGFGQSLAFASDIIIAREDARFMDHHMSGVFKANYSGEIKEGGHDFSSVPGDGGAALIPLYMSPPKAKEYLMLAKPYTALELAKMGLINYAVPASQLDAKVDEIVSQLLERGAYALAWAKRVANRRVVDQLNMTLDAGQAYEMLVWLQREKLGWKEKRTLD
jgi:enoyl-CoA hydratase